MLPIHAMAVMTIPKIISVLNIWRRALATSRIVLNVILLDVKKKGNMANAGRMINETIFGDFDDFDCGSGRGCGRNGLSRGNTTVPAG